MRIAWIMGLLMAWAAVLSAAEVTRIDVYPPDVHLNTQRDYQRSDRRGQPR
jgi:hypothetical protein